MTATKFKYNSDTLFEAAKLEAKSWLDSFRFDGKHNFKKIFENMPRHQWINMLVRGPEEVFEMCIFSALLVESEIRSKTLKDLGIKVKVGVAKLTKSSYKFDDVKFDKKHINGIVCNQVLGQIKEELNSKEKFMTKEEIAEIYSLLEFLSDDKNFVKKTISEYFSKDIIALCKETLKNTTPWDSSWDYYFMALYESAYKGIAMEDRPDFIKDSYFESYKNGLWGIINLGSVRIGVTMPVIKVNKENRLHCEDGPAVSWADGSRSFWLQNIKFEPKYIEQKDDMGLKEILELTNQEAKRVWVEMVTYEKLAPKLDLKKIATDDWAILWELPSPGLGDDDNKAARFISVVCSSTERQYPLNRVSPDCPSPVAGLAERFGVSVEEYKTLKMQS